LGGYIGQAGFFICRAGFNAIAFAFNLNDGTGPSCGWVFIGTDKDYKIRLQRVDGTDNGLVASAYGTD
jgi:hypothetical protein